MIMTITRASATSSTHVVTHARIPVCGDRSASLSPDLSVLPDASPFVGPWASVRGTCHRRLAQTQRYAFSPALQSP